MRNARDRGREDLAQEARRHAIELRAKAYGASDSVEMQCLEAIYAYEEVLSAKRGHRTHASRTWPMVKRHGILEAVDRVVSRPDDATGYTALLEMGLEKFAFEAVVVRHPEFFSPQALKRSRMRVAKWKLGA
jgi:hypothetical protein